CQGDMRNAGHFGQRFLGELPALPGGRKPTRIEGVHYFLVTTTSKSRSGSSSTGCIAGSGVNDSLTTQMRFEKPSKSLPSKTFGQDTSARTDSSSELTQISHTVGVRPYMWTTLPPSGVLANSSPW